jgi:adhesin transport system membrane fusion protein
MIFLGAFGAVGLWGAVAKLDVVSQAMGVVTPKHPLALVQHLEGGIVYQLHVKPGDKVGEGAELITLESIGTAAEVEELDVQMIKYLTDQIRLQAELAGDKQLVFSSEHRKAHPKLVAEAHARFELRTKQITNLLGAQTEAALQQKENARKMQGRIESTKKLVEFVDEQVKISYSLLEENLTNRMLHLNLLREQGALLGALQEDEAELVRVESAIREADLRILSVRDNYREKAREELSEKKMAADALRERRSKLTDDLDRTILRSPIAGVVKRIHANTVGGVIHPGATVVEVVPEGRDLIVEAQLPVHDVGYIELGQEVNVRLASLDAARFGKIDGVVSHISADSITDEDGMDHYIIKIDIDDTVFVRGGRSYAARPGVNVVCAILVGERTVFDYIFDPFLTESQTALTER